jgi:copper chaperone CopZ
MKKLIMLFCMSVIVTGVSAQFNKASLQASGLTCSMCNNAIYKALKALPFVSSVTSNIKNASFEVSFKEGAAVEIDALKKAVEDAGFSVATFTITGKFDRLAIGNDKHVAIGNKHFHFVKVGDQILDGEKTITLVDKGFLTTKNFKKYVAATGMPCIQTGRAGSCCEKEGLKAEARVYHVTI